MDLPLFLADVLHLDPSYWDWSSLIRLLVAAVLGGLIGLEREVHGRSAGLRTQMLVALGAALAMVVSLNFAKVFGEFGTPETIRVDPARVAYGVMVGIGFVGAGAIINSGLGIRGLTTAASLWCTAAVGLACGFGMYGVALGATGITLFALLVLRYLDEALPQRSDRRLTIVVAGAKVAPLRDLKGTLAQHGVHVRRVDLTRDFVDGTTTIGLVISTGHQPDAHALAELAGKIEGVRSVRIE